MNFSFKYILVANINRSCFICTCSYRIRILLSKSFWRADRTLAGITKPGQSGLWNNDNSNLRSSLLRCGTRPNEWGPQWNNDNKGLLHTEPHQLSVILRAALLGGLASRLGMQSAYSKLPLDWVVGNEAQYVFKNMNMIQLHIT